MISIAGSTVQPKDNIVIDRNRLEEHDSGFITVLTPRQERYETYDLVEITINGTTEQMLVQADVVSKYKEGLYEHEITLIENVARFDAYFPADRIFSSTPPKSIAEILNVYKRELGTYHSLPIDFDGLASWVVEPIRQKEFVGLNFSVILMDLFKSINAIPRVTYQNDVWFIEPEFFKDRNNLIDITPQTEQRRQNNADYATRIKSTLKNVLNDEPVFFPSANGYILPKSSTPQFAESRLQYQLDSKIADVLEVLAVDVQIRSVGNNTVVYDGNVDISKYVVPKTQYDGLPTPADQYSRTQTDQDGLHKKNTVFYQIGGNTIENLFAAGTEILVFNFGDNTDFLKNAIVNAGADSGFYSIGTDTSGYVVDNDLEKIKLRIKYIKQRDLDITTHRAYLKNMNESTQTHRQRDSFADIERYKLGLRAIINRMGNEVREQSKTLPVSDIGVQLGDYNKDNFVVIRVKRTIYNDSITYEYVLAEGFGNIDADTSLWREPSAFEIQQKDITTNLIVEEFIEISEEKKDITTRLTTDGIETLLSTLDGTITNHGKIHAALLRTTVSNNADVSINGIYLPAYSSGGGNTCTYHVGIDNPVSAGRGYIDAYENGEFGIDFIYTYGENDPLGPFGELKEFRLFFIPDVGKEDIGLYPIADANETQAYLNNALTQTDIVDRIDKDKNAKFALTYEQHFVTDNQDIIVCNGLSKYNRLVSTATPDTMRLVKSDTPFNVFDIEVRDTDTTLSGSITIDLTERRIRISVNEDADNYAIAFGDELVLGFNRKIFAGETFDYYINLRENAERVVSNLLDGPTLFGSNTTTDSVTATLFNTNNEAVIINASYGGTDFSEQVTATTNDPFLIPDATANFTFSNLEPNFPVPIQAFNEPLEGSGKVASPSVTYTLTTQKIPLDAPIYSENRFETYDFNGETKYILFYNVQNTNDIPLDFVFEIDGYEHIPAQNPIPANSTVEVGIALLGSDQSDPANRIDAETDYTFRTRWETTTFSFNWRTDFTANDNIYIGPFVAPSHFASSVTAATVTFSWNAENTLGEQLQVQLLSAPFPQGTVEQTKTVTVSTSQLLARSTSVTFTGVDSETFYGSRAKILASGFNEESATADSPTIETLAFQNQSAPTWDGLGVSVTTSSITTSFGNPNNHSVNMFAQITEQGSGVVLDTDTVGISGNNSNSVSFNGLDPNTSYIISAYFEADNLYNQSGTTATSVINTRKETTADPTILNVNKTSDTITWDVRNNDSDFAAIRYGLDTQNPTIATNQVASNGTVSLLLSGLDPNTQYTIAVEAEANGKDTSDLIEETVTTDNVPATQWVYIGQTLPAGVTHDEFVGGSTPSPIPTTCPTENQAVADALALLNNTIDPTTKLVGYIVRMTRLANSPLRTCFTMHFEAQ